MFDKVDWERVDSFLEPIGFYSYLIAMVIYVATFIQIVVTVLGGTP